MNILIILGMLFIFVYNLSIFFNILILFILNDSCVDKMLYEINELADYIANIMEFYYPSMFRNLNNLCFPAQVNNLINIYYFCKLIII